MQAVSRYDMGAEGIVLASPCRERSVAPSWEGRFDMLFAKSDALHLLLSTIIAMKRIASLTLCPTLLYYEATEGVSRQTTVCYNHGASH
jgi:hypothetical protein